MKHESRRSWPDSEYRRQYAKDLVKELAAHGDLSNSDARKVASAFVSYLAAKVAAGESIDLGFMKLQATTTRPMAVTTAFAGRDRTFMLGQSRRWRVTLRKSWLRKVKPEWSRW